MSSTRLRLWAAYLSGSKNDELLKNRGNPHKPQAIVSDVICARSGWQNGGGTSKKENRNERINYPLRHGFGQRRCVAARVELAGRRFARRRLGGIENLSRQIAHSAASSL